MLDKIHRPLSFCFLCFKKASESLNDFVHVLLHVVYLFAYEFQGYVWLVALSDLRGQLAKDLTLYIFGDLLFSIAALFKPVIQLGVVASEQYDQLEPSLREEVAGVKLEYNATPLAHERL